MLRGSRPGERRGGRTRGTPNRRSVLAERILAIGTDHPTASRGEFLERLIKDPKLPADIRMAVAPSSFPAKRALSSRSDRAVVGPRKTTGHDATTRLSVTPPMVPIRDWTPEALDALLSVVQDASADPKTKRKAAVKFAEFLLPKTPKKPKALIDEYGFSVSPILFSAYRDILLERRALMKEPQQTRRTPIVAEQIETLEALSDAILKRCQVPCSSKYSRDAVEKDETRWLELAESRGEGRVLSEAEKTEEAHVRLRYRVFMASPEANAWRRLKALADAELAFKKYQFCGGRLAKPLSRAQRDELQLLRKLYAPRKKLHKTNDGDDPLVAEMLDSYHPFRDEWPSSNGSFYPPDSKVRPLGVITETWSGPDRPKEPPSICREYVIETTGQGASQLR